MQKSGRHLHHELPVRYQEDRSDGESLLQSSESNCSPQWPGEGGLGAGQPGEWSCHRADITDEPAVKISLSFFSTKKNPAPAGEEEGLMIPATRELLMYSSMA